MVQQLPGKILRKMNYLSDQRGIIKRYINEKQGWDIHLTNTKKYITDYLKDKMCNSVAILGSGWLLDVPLEYLVNTLDKIILVDINHPHQIKHKVRRFENVELKCADISDGVIRQVYNLIKNYRRSGIKKDLKELEFPVFKPEEQADFKISLNILNQLDILLTDYLKKFSIYDESELNFFRSRIQKSHIGSLIPGKSCLITDYEEEIYNMDGTPDSKRKLVYTDLQDGINRKTWKWNFDMSGSYYNGKKTVFNVIAMEL
jgi:hypothetical protein